MAGKPEASSCTRSLAAHLDQDAALLRPSVAQAVALHQVILLERKRFVELYIALGSQPCCRLAGPLRRSGYLSLSDCNIFTTENQNSAEAGTLRRSRARKTSAEAGKQKEANEPKTSRTAQPRE